MNTVNNSAARLTYELGKDMLAAAEYTVQEGKLSQSYLRCEIPISATTTRYKIPVLINEMPYGTPLSTEKRLNLQDGFMIAEIFIGLGVRVGSSADAAFEPLTYPDPSVFTTNGAARSAMTMYNGWLEGMVNNDNIVPAWSISRHLVRQRTQGGVIITAQTIAPFNSIDFSTDGFYPVQPILVHVGSKNIQWTINLPAAIATVQALSYIIVEFRGLLAQNCTPVR